MPSDSGDSISERDRAVIKRRGGEVVKVACDYDEMMRRMWEDSDDE